MSNKELIILSGLPGSGKTTIAKMMVADHEARGERACICSADDYFMEDGQYVFRAEELERAHETCQMSAERAMANGYDLVVIDNTNTTDWERWPYIKLAEKFQYKATVRVVGGTTSEDVETYLKRQVHGVPRGKVEQMAARLAASPTARLRKCEKCHGEGPCLWDPPTQRYLCRGCHSDPTDPFFHEPT